MKQYKVLQWAFSFLKKHDREERVAEILLQHLTEQNPATFFMNMQELIDEKTITEFKKLIIKYARKGTPVQHITGIAPFYGRDFSVNENVLIPRFETEEVVYQAIERISKISSKSPVKVADLGTGSGVIAITIALEISPAEIYATDISEKALETARQNATKHGADIHFYQGDFLAPLIEKRVNPEIIISNPPYI